MVEQHGKTLVPQIRFAGFTDPWEQRKLGELYKEVSEKNDLTYGRDRIISVAHMYFNPVVYVTEDDYLKTYNVMRLGDIAFERMGVWWKTQLAMVLFRMFSRFFGRSSLLT